MILVFKTYNPHHVIFAMQLYMNMIPCSKGFLSQRIFQIYFLLWHIRDLQLINLDTSLRQTLHMLIYYQDRFYDFILFLSVIFLFSYQSLVVRQYHIRIIHSYTRNLNRARDCGLHFKMQLSAMVAYGQFQDHIKVLLSCVQLMLKFFF